jgi:hypothetical protein
MLSEFSAWYSFISVSELKVLTTNNIQVYLEFNIEVNQYSEKCVEK